MKKNRLIFYSIFAAYHLVVVLFTLYVKSKQQDPLSLLKFLSYISLFFYGTVLGFVMMVVDFIWTWRAQRASNEEGDELTLENNTLKAKIYDLQEGKKEHQFTPPAVK